MIDEESATGKNVSSKSGPVQGDHFLDQWTVWFTSTLCRLLPQTLCTVRMDVFQKDPRFLQRLLLPLLSEYLLPLVADSARRQNGLPHIVTMQVEHSDPSHTRPTMRTVMRQARERCLAALFDDDRRSFLEECRRLDGAGKYELGPCCIPYVNNGALHIVEVAFVNGMVSISYGKDPVDLDAEFGFIPGMTFLFRPDKLDRSDCFTC